MPVVQSGLRNKGQFDAKAAIQKFEEQHGEGSYARAIETSRATRAARAAAGGGGPSPISEPMRAAVADPAPRGAAATKTEVLQYFAKKLGELKPGDYRTQVAEVRFPIGGGSPYYKMFVWNDHAATIGESLETFKNHIDLQTAETIQGQRHRFIVELNYSQKGVHDDEMFALIYSPSTKVSQMSDLPLIYIIREAIREEIARMPSQSTPVVDPTADKEKELRALDDDIYSGRIYNTLQNEKDPARTVRDLKEHIAGAEARARKRIALARELGKDLSIYEQELKTAQGQGRSMYFNAAHKYIKKHGG